MRVYYRTERRKGHEIIREDHSVAEGIRDDAGRTGCCLQREQAVHLKMGGGYRFAGGGKTVAPGPGLPCVHGCAAQRRTATKRRQGGA